MIVVDASALLAIYFREPERDRFIEALRAAFSRYGKRTPAKLNLGDCFAYALAKQRKARLLFKGDDFVSTDVEPA